MAGGSGGQLRGYDMVDVILTTTACMQANSKIHNAEEEAFAVASSSSAAVSQDLLFEVSLRW